MSSRTVPFSRPYRAHREIENLSQVLESGHVHGDGAFTASATEKLRAIGDSPFALLTSSGTHALEMASLLLDIGPGDEVILPSFTFPSAATAIAITGATPVFVDIDPLTGNLDPAKVAEAVGPATRAISVVHYGGVGADMDALSAIGSEFGLPLIEDNAHGLGGLLNGRKLGSIGAVAAQSFHDTKNVHSGEGGAIMINDPTLRERAEIIREKGTNRSRFLRGQVDKYTWTDIGSSYLMSELSAAVLDAQLAEFDLIQSLRHAIWDRYASELTPGADELGATLMPVGPGREHTAHVFYMLLPNVAVRDDMLRHLRHDGVTATFHYIPLDSSPGGMRLARTPFECSASADFSSRLLRLPLWAGMSEDDTSQVIDSVLSYRSRAAA